jgi:hypothetical protein
MDVIFISQREAAGASDNASFDVDEIIRLHVKLPPSLSANTAVLLCGAATPGIS